MIYCLKTVNEYGQALLNTVIKVALLITLLVVERELRDRVDMKTEA